MQKSTKLALGGGFLATYWIGRNVFVPPKVIDLTKIVGPREQIVSCNTMSMLGFFNYSQLWIDTPSMCFPVTMIHLRRVKFIG